MSSLTMRNPRAASFTSTVRDGYIIYFIYAHLFEESQSF